MVSIYTCAESESFANDKCCCCLFVFLVGDVCIFDLFLVEKRGVKYHYERAIIGPPTKRHLNGVSLGVQMMAQHGMLAL